MELKHIPHPEFKHLIGKKCDFVVGPLRFSNRDITFIGRNAVGHDVITYLPQGIVHIKNWERVKFYPHD